jgi:hypothetical protein
MLFGFGVIIKPDKNSASLTRTQNQDVNRDRTLQYTENIETYQLYLKGRYFWNERTEEDIEQAIGYFKHAIDKDLRYAQADVSITVVKRIGLSLSNTISISTLPYIRHQIAIKFKQTVSDLAGLSKKIQVFLNRKHL